MCTLFQKRLKKLFSCKGKEISKHWRKKQVEYFMLHRVTGDYKPFSEVTRNALLYTLRNLKLECKENAVYRKRELGSALFFFYDYLF
jgi:2-haloacid dehalogenase